MVEQQICTLVLLRGLQVDLKLVVRGLGKGYHVLCISTILEIPLHLNRHPLIVGIDVEDSLYLAQLLYIILNVIETTTIGCYLTLGLHQYQEMLHVPHKDLLAIEVDREHFLSVVDLHLSQGHIGLLIKLKTPKTNPII